MASRPDGGGAAAATPEIACPGCGSARAREAWRAGDRVFGTTPETFSAYRCRDCTLIYLWPVPDAARLARYYPSGYWVPDGGDVASGVRARLTERYRRVMLRDHVGFVRRALDGQRRHGVGRVELLDVGCGDGAFLAALGHPHATGLDVSTEAVAACRTRGLRARTGQLDDGPFPAGQRFDVVTMFHVLEHVSPPASLLDAVRQVLAPTGDLIVQVPNAESVQARLLGPRWAGFDVPRHLVDYTPSTLTATLKRAGFDVVQTSCRSLRDNPMLLACSVAPGLYPPRRRVHAGGGASLGAWLGDLTFLALTLLCLPPALLEAEAGYGAAITVRARLRTSSRARSHRA